MLVEHLRYMAAHVIIPAQGVSVSDNQHFWQLVAPGLVEKLTVGTSQLEM